EYDLSSVTAAVIKGMLQSVVDVRVNIINAMRLAGQRGLAVSEQKTLRTSQYDNLISVQVMNGGGTRKVSGALVQDEPHIVGLDDIWVDFPAQGHLLLTRHHDRPGIIGRIGTMLGDADVNISFMHVGRQTPRGEAIMVLGTDEPIPEALYDLVKDVSHTYWVQAIAL
ncbi:MAG: ACT domain-containing protein, partial [Anaerolineae bacterium]